MSNVPLFGRTVRLTTLYVVSLILPVVAAAGSPSEKALLLSHDDPHLEWGPCPEFLPEGCAIAVLHGDPAGDNADIFLKVPAGADLPHHWHSSAERMILVSGELRLEYDGQDPKTMRQGSYAYGPAELPHKGRCAAGDPCILFIAFEQPVDAVPLD